MSATQSIARYLVDTRYDDLPDTVVAKAKQCVLDSIGCSLAGAGTRQGRVYRDIAAMSAVASSPAATVFGGGFRTSPAEAAFCNAMTANVLEIDDSYDHPGSILFSHPGATVIPAAIAVAELAGKSGRDVLEAVVVGYEICLRVGVAVQPTFERAMKECWGCATFQTFGAAAAASKLLGLDLGGTLSALGIAGATAPVSSTLKVWRPDRTDLNNGYGWAAEAGVRGALMASFGYSGPADILDGDNGFWRMYGSDQCDFDAFTDGLGERYLIEAVSFKPWAACRWEHPVMDAGRLVVEQNGFRLDDAEAIGRIERVVVKTFGALLRPPYDNFEPKTLVEGQFSTAFCAAVAILDVPLVPDLFQDGRITDARVPTLMSKISLECDPRADSVFPGNGGDALASGVEVVIGGRRMEAFVPCALGDPRNPWPQEDIEARFLSTAADDDRRLRLAEAVALIRDLDRQPCVNHIADLVR